MIKLIKDTLKSDIHNQAKVFHRKKGFIMKCLTFTLLGTGKHRLANLH